MIPVLKLPFSFDPLLLQKELQNFTADDWIPHFNTQNYRGDWSGIAFRAPRGSYNQIYPDPNPKDGYEDTEQLARCDYIQKVLGEFECEFESVRFLKLSAGSIIREHRDYNLSYEDGAVRVHIPVKTNPQVEFIHDGQKIQMNEGEAWYLNFNLMHSVKNNGTEARVHLIVDCISNDWIDQFFTSVG